MALPTWAPTPQNVADILLSRTDDEWGVQTGSFSNTTTPSITQVARLINIATTDVVTHMVAYLPSAMDANFIVTAGPGPFDESAKTVVLYRTCVLVELAFFSKQIQPNQSAETQYEKMYTESLTALDSRIMKYNEEFNTDQVPDADDPTLPRYYFGSGYCEDPYQQTFWGSVFY